MENKCIAKDTKQIRLLLEKGSDVNFKDSAGKTPIYYSIDQLDNETIKLLLDYKTIQENNRMIIYASITGYGSKGPSHNKVAFDLIM